MGAVIERIRAAVNWPARFQGVADSKRPATEKAEQISRRFHEWDQREAARGNMTTTCPSEVNEALAKAAHEGRQAAQSYFAQHEGRLLAELEERASAVETAYAALVAEMGELRDYESNYNRLARECGVRALPASIADTTITADALWIWRDRVQHVLHPPQPQPRMRAAENPLRLD